MRWFVPVLLILVLLPLHAVSLRSAATAWKSMPQGDGSGYALPAPILKLTALEFDGVASDFLFLRALVFLGSTLERDNGPHSIKKSEWRSVHRDLAAATDLDPYFLDPYYVAQANLTWDGKMFRETNLLLEKGIQARDWDWMLPFFAGFNSFYFLQENEQASLYLMESAKRPGATSLVTTLAARLAYKGHNTENAIIFLTQMLEEETEESVKAKYSIRLAALGKIYFLETKVADFKKMNYRPPASLAELIISGMIPFIPEDPYGGKFYIDSDGTIKTSSNLVQQ